MNFCTILGVLMTKLKENKGQMKCTKYTINILNKRWWSFGKKNNKTLFKTKIK